MNTKMVGVSIGFDTRDDYRFFFYSWSRAQPISNWIWLNDLFIPNFDSAAFYTRDINVVREIVESQLTLSQAKSIEKLVVDDVKQIETDTHDLNWSEGTTEQKMVDCGVNQISYKSDNEVYMEVLFRPNFKQWDKIQKLANSHLFYKYFPGQIL